MIAKCLKRHTTIQKQHDVDGKVAPTYIYLKHQHVLAICYNVLIVQQ